MPFTFSHPAIVIPLKKWKPGWFSYSGLVIGSMSPDMLYFIQMDGEADYGHSLPGIFMFDIPFTLLATVFFHRWLRNILILYLPSPLNRKYAKYLPLNVFPFLRRKWYVVGLSGFIGAVSHILWDQVGSVQGWVYQQDPQFFEKHVQIGFISLELYVFIEYLWSVLGLLFIGWVVFQEKEEFAIKQVSALSKFYFWFSILFVTGAVIIIKLLADPQPYSLGSLFVIGISGFFLALLISCFLFSFSRSAKKI